MNEWWLAELLRSGGFGGVTVNVMFLAGLLTALLWKPERIRRVKLFRWACTCFVFAVAVPPVVTAVLTSYMTSGGRYNGPPPFLWIIQAAGPLFSGSAMLLGFSALMPELPSRKRQPGKSTAAKHPLD